MVTITPRDMAENHNYAIFSATHKFRLDHSIKTTDLDKCATVSKWLFDSIQGDVVYNTFSIKDDLPKKTLISADLLEKPFDKIVSQSIFVAKEVLASPTSKCLLLTEMATFPFRNFNTAIKSAEQLIACNHVDPIPLLLEIILAKADSA